MGLRSRPRNSAFSLLEVIIAIAILSVGIIWVLQALSFSTRVTGLSCDMISASFLAKDRMQELEFKEINKLLDKEPGQSNEVLGKFQWQDSIVLNSDLKLYQVNYEVNWQRSNRQEQISLSTYLRK